MNKYSFDRTGFEVTRANSRCAGARAEQTNCRIGEIKGSYGETLNRAGARGERSEACEGCGMRINSRYGLTDRPAGSVYAPLQDFDGIYEPDKALARGTLFSSLDLPLAASRGGGSCHG